MTDVLITKNKLLFISAVAVCCIISGLFVKNAKQTTTKEVFQEKSDVQKDDFVVHDVGRFFDEFLFQKGIAENKKQIQIQDKIRGAIMPHHLIPSFIIASIFKSISEQNIETIILLSPNHYDIGDTPVVTSKISWETPYGKIEPNNKIIQQLLQKDYISVDEAVLDNEHGIAGLLPFVAYYDKSTKIVPLALRQNLTKEQLQDLSSEISNIIDDKTIVVASVDFSHYLTSEQAQKNDEKTLQVLQQRNYDELSQMNNDYLDSPESIAMLLYIMDNINIKGENVMYHTNSGELLDNPIDGVTSYFGVLFTQ